jgi:hypothetical protein
MPKGEGPTVKVLVVDPRGDSRPIERSRIELDVSSSQEAA